MSAVSRRSSGRPGTVKRAQGPRHRFDVVVVGGGPAGSTLGWSLATRGVRVAILERTTFPREKVCGDFIEPRGLRLLEKIGCLPSLEATRRLPITHVAMFLDGQRAYRGSIPFYGRMPELPPHGYIVPRNELDTELIECARRTGAMVFEDCAALEVERRNGRLRIAARRQGGSATFEAPLVVGADGAHSVVARCAGLLREDARYIAVSQRAYVHGVSVESGEAAFFFDRDLFPGYGWMFPMPGGRANVGVGVLAEARARWGVTVPQLFQAFLDKLREQHPGCRGAHLASKPLGGIVRTYGCAGPNHFDGGVLIGDAGCFVDPMTGEGITPAIESALLAAPVLANALEQKRTDAACLSAYEAAFRRYFDPSMGYLDLCAAVMRNRHMRDFWLGIVTRGCWKAADDEEFACVAGATFGGLNVQPLDILTRVWAKLVEDAGAESTRLWLDMASGRAPAPHAWWSDCGAFLEGWWRSVFEDPVWHASWMSDVVEKWTKVALELSTERDPRLQGPLSPLASGSVSSTEAISTADVYSRRVR